MWKEQCRSSGRLEVPGMTTRRSKLVDARDIFRALLSKGDTDERTWQGFFADHPYVLSMSLPLRLEPRDIIALARPGRTEPDFIFYPRNEMPIPFYGVIELKRPDSRIVTIGRENVALLTRDAEIAVQQGIQSARLTNRHLRNSGPTLFLGNDAYIFVIMGMARELGDKLGIQLYREMVQSRLPANLQILPFDTLLSKFEARLPPRVYFLTPLGPDFGPHAENWDFTLDTMPRCLYSGKEVQTVALRNEYRDRKISPGKICAQCKQAAVVKIEGVMQNAAFGTTDLLADTLCLYCGDCVGSLRLTEN